MRIGSIYHLSKLWKTKFFILCDVIFLVRLQGKFEIDHSWEHKHKPRVNRDDASTSASTRKRSAFLFLVLALVLVLMACACACVVRLNQPLGGRSQDQIYSPSRGGVWSSVTENHARRQFFWDQICCSPSRSVRLCGADCASLRQPSFSSQDRSRYQKQRNAAITIASFVRGWKVISLSPVQTSRRCAGGQLATLKAHLHYCQDPFINWSGPDKGMVFWGRIHPPLP